MIEDYVLYFLARIRLEAQTFWLIMTGRGEDDAPESLMRAYNAQADLWNHIQNMKREKW